MPGDSDDIVVKVHFGEDLVFLLGHELLHFVGFEQTGHVVRGEDGEGVLDQCRHQVAVVVRDDIRRAQVALVTRLLAFVRVTASSARLLRLLAVIRTLELGEVADRIVQALLRQLQPLYLVEEVLPILHWSIVQFV